jgi:hypothetical protein
MYWRACPTSHLENICIQTDHQADVDGFAIKHDSAIDSNNIVNIILHSSRVMIYTCRRISAAACATKDMVPWLHKHHYEIGFRMIPGFLHLETCGIFEKAFLCCH